MISVTPSTTLGKHLFQFAFGEWLSATTKLKFYSSGLLPRFFTRDFASSTGKSVYGGFTEIDGDWPRIMRTNLPLESAAQFAGLYGHLHLTGAFRRIEFAESVIRGLREMSRDAYGARRIVRTGIYQLVVSLNFFYSYRPRPNAPELPFELANSDPARVIRETIDYLPILACDVEYLHNLIRTNCSDMSKVLILCDKSTHPGIDKFIQFGCTIHPCDEIERFLLLSNADRLISILTESDW